MALLALMATVLLSMLETASAKEEEDIRPKIRRPRLRISPRERAQRRRQSAASSANKKEDVVADDDDSDEDEDLRKQRQLPAALRTRKRVGTKC